MTSKSISYKLSKTEKLISITFQFEKKKKKELGTFYVKIKLNT